MHTSSRPRRAREATQKTLDHIRKSQKDAPLDTPIETGFLNLDSVIGGFGPGTLVLLTAVRGNSATDFYLALARQTAMINKRATVIFSQRNSAETTLCKLIAISTKITTRRLESGPLTKSEWDAIDRESLLISDAALFIEDDDLTLPQIFGMCIAQAESRDGLKLIIIDSLTRLNRSESSPGARDTRPVTARLKQLAVDLGITIVVVAAVSSGANYRTGLRPSIADLRKADSDAADIVLLIHRDETYETYTAARDVAEIIVAKNQGGTVGKVDLLYQENIGLFKSMERSH